MRVNTKTTVLFLLGLAVLALVACGTDSGVAASQAGDAVSDARSVSVADETHADDEDTHAVAVADEHDDAGGQADLVADIHDDGDGHDDMVADIDDDEAMESHGHAEMNAPVDPDAPVMYVSATEFGYDTATVEVEAGQPFSIQIHNEGMLEHDITFVGLESEFGLHVQPGEENIATWSIHEPGEYVYYCTVLGHRDAGMTGTLIVSAELVSDHDEADGHHDEADEAAHEDDHDDETAHGDTVQIDAPGA